MPPLEMLGLTKLKRQEAKREMEGLKIISSLGVIWMDRIGNEYIRGRGQVEQFGDKVKEAGLRWFGHVQRSNSGYIEQKK